MARTGAAPHESDRFKGLAFYQYTYEENTFEK
jgi:hypothetical protein